MKFFRLHFHLGDCWLTVHVRDVSLEGATEEGRDLLRSVGVSHWDGRLLSVELTEHEYFASIVQDWTGFAETK